MTRVYRLGLATFVSALALIALGGLARLQPAGSGCGNDWPRCDGSWLPALAWQPLVEYAHRGLALAVIVLSLATAVLAWRTPRVSRVVRLSSLFAVAIIVLQSAIGGAVALWGAPPGIATLHLATAMLFLACALVTVAGAAADRGAPAPLAALGRFPAPSADRLLAVAASAAAAVAFALVIFGASTSASGAFACAAWPLCAGEATGADIGPVIHLGYRATALLGTLAAMCVAVLAWRRHAPRSVRWLATGAVALVAFQSGLNAVASVSGDPVWISAPHLVIAALFWLAMLGVALCAWTADPKRVLEQAPEARRDTGSTPPIILPSAGTPVAIDAMALTAAQPALRLDLSPQPLFAARRVVADYVALTKPGIMSLLLTTTLCAMLMAARGLPSFWLVAVTMLGGMLAAGGANVLNCYLDRDIDSQMSRTRHRATVAGRVSPQAALAFGLSLTVAAVLLLGFAVNWTAAALALAGNLYYVFIYTKWLKRSTPYNIVIGGGAGAVPPLVGWAAVTGDLSPLAWGLFAIVFAWTPPHFWALALLKQGEYTRAAVPMLPVVSGEAETRRQIVIYTVALCLVCLALAPLGLGRIYLAAAMILNGLFLCLAIRLYRQPSKRIARQLFFYSLWYLALLFAAAVADRIISA